MQFYFLVIVLVLGVNCGILKKRDVESEQTVGKCHYSDGTVTSNGWSSEATPEQKLKVAEWKGQMEIWEKEYDAFMDSVVPDAQGFKSTDGAPAMPMFPCLCEVSVCKA